MICRRFSLIAVALLATTSLTVARTAQPVATDCTSFMRNIRMSEGSGNYQTNTGNGFYGAYQMGEDALTDAGYMDGNGNWTGRNGVNSLEDYLNNSTAQDDAFLRYGEKNLGYLNGWEQYIGQTIGGAKVTRAGLIAGAHLVGAGGLKYWLTSGGDCTNKGTGSDAVDGNGTCAGTYMAENQVDKQCGPGDSDGGGGSCLVAHPVQSPVIFSEYGAFNRPGVSGGNNGWHRGADIYPNAAQGGASMGQPLFAAHDGKLTIGSDGLKVAGDQFRTLYLHSGSMPDIRDVKAGEEIGKIGDKKAAGKPHLHFEVQVPKSAVTATRCIMAQTTDDCAFPVGSGKHDPNAYSTAQSLAAASPNSWYYVNPERYLKERVPVTGAARARTGRSESLPNSCTPGTSVSETPMSGGEVEPAAAIAGGYGEYLSGEGSGVANADKELRSIVIDMARQSALDVRAASSSAAQMQARFDAATAQLLSLYGRAGE
uniref:M23 family metallopeptidase n=1 Tax=Brucella pseudintermedia TaxID=370111 RepID=UPI00158ED08F|nr:M23 family metallopeptidase [Brucella pseudintermedia]